MTGVLTDQQKRFFDLFGYLALPALLADVIDEVTNECEAVWSRHNAKRYDVNIQRLLACVQLDCPSGGG
jgi:hypothetical protein